MLMENERSWNSASLEGSRVRKADGEPAYLGTRVFQEVGEVIENQLMVGLRGMLELVPLSAQI